MEERNTEENATSSNATELERKQWHGPYFGSMRLELKSSKEDCEYRDEYPLNKKALQIDMLAVAKRKLAWVLDEITANFRKHNIIEFKSPDDDLNLDVFYKTVGYACLYKAQESRVGEIPETEIAITFIRERKPEKLLQKLEEWYHVERCAPGIYRVETDKPLFPVQILVLREMEWRKHIWLTALQRKISLEHARALVLEANKLKHPDEKEWADAVFQLVVANNKEIFEQLIQEGKNMCQALRELLDDQIQEEVNDAEARGIEIGEARGEARAATTIGDILCRLSSGEDEETIRSSGVNNEVLAIARNVFQRQMNWLHMK